MRAHSTDDARKNKEVIDKFPDILDKTRIIWTSELIPADPQVVRADLNKGQVAKLKAALLKLSSDPEGKQFIKDLFTIDSLQEAVDGDYDVLRDVVKAVDPSLLKLPTATPSAIDGAGLRGGIRIANAAAQPRLRPSSSREVTWRPKQRRSASASSRSSTPRVRSQCTT
ncbi:MAG: PhnD/SsuA/transferrin family substrate-binding protein [Thermomicrobiales bacterium]